ncbi:hypothetical protein BpHYR1_048093 [Brachionus plicatilis]|uniref:Uncharacterized protein n=1 Tax=Brachionus plicatilis TaxID=10195 RepID=A0A3M7S955_BRAPC|nr:hypothetical protein BpHYR1_048093 [Brachionus plicatilis]
MYDKFSSLFIFLDFDQLVYLLKNKFKYLIQHCQTAVFHSILILSLKISLVLNKSPKILFAGLN